MKALIIGGTGLISTAITRTLITRGDDVTLYNRGQTDADIPVGWMPATAFTTKMNPRFTVKLLRDGRTSVRKRLFQRI